MSTAKLAQAASGVVGLALSGAAAGCVVFRNMAPVMAQVAQTGAEVIGATITNPITSVLEVVIKFDPLGGFFQRLR